MKTAEQTGNHLRYLATMTFAAVAAGLLLHNAAAQSPPPGVPAPNDTWKLPNREDPHGGRSACAGTGIRLGSGYIWSSIRLLRCN